ncbi:hypothetical protein OCHUTO_0234 [Orientia chuto str. Dubai]|uniref:Uncharacterized protein n=1 Tax=Orientia chuto str. Dubai TaxID=1359168 RepID=A0A0F3MR77_9RICK|nr:hypothetical protein OCHUTO_0234 [Orientia chuto str. Dubai]
MQVLQINYSSFISCLLCNKKIICIISAYSLNLLSKHPVSQPIVENFDKILIFLD